jgi:ribosomal protein L20A (L18A)
MSNDYRNGLKTFRVEARDEQGRRHTTSVSAASSASAAEAYYRDWGDRHGRVVHIQEVV